MFTDGMSRLAVGVSLMLALSLALFLTIAVLLLADLFCSHLRRRWMRAEEGEALSRRRAKLGLAGTSRAAAGDDDAASVATTATTTTAREALSSTPPFYYAQGVMQAAADTKDLLLAIPKLESAVWRWSPARRSSPSSSSSANSDRFVCISNPVYERGAAPPADVRGDTDTPFETPDASPSPFGITEEVEEEGGEFSPPLSVMRKLPPLGVVACPPPSMGFIDGRPSLGFTDGRPSLTAWSGTVTDTNRASSSSSNLTAHFFSSWSPK
ncbi:hypothetical protein OsJ_16415 [Oryza sativa Japonica Group]|uniref:Uncharacterized protein n=1 Tax=Oryza sativa subsp. japonica TaxID=39947 RepID=B9FCU7_ORYSJ|nr:hypothetical protein OsJ_16415 [Oryza sativa Japonica Group]